jgi:hypothetical protein
MGEKSLIGSKVKLGLTAEFKTKLVDATKSVEPSGLALETKSLAMLPLAPGLLSTTTTAPNRALSSLAKSLAKMSGPAAGVVGTIKLMLAAPELDAHTIKSIAKQE